MSTLLQRLRDEQAKHAPDGSPAKQRREKKAAR